MKLFFTFIFSFNISCVQSQNILAIFEVDPGNHIRHDTPVSVSLDDLTLNTDLIFPKLEEMKGAKKMPVPCQVENGNPPRLWWILNGETSAGQKRTFCLTSGVKKVYPDGIKIKKTDRGSILQAGDRNVLLYQDVIESVPEGVDQVYAKSGFIHPLWSPDGDTLTRIQPPDHYHHYGIWGPYTRTQIGEHNTDFWNLGEKQGTVRFLEYESIIEGPVFGEITVLQEHVDFQHDSEEKVVFIEKLAIRVWNLPASNSSSIFLWEYTSSLDNILTIPVYLLAYRYGGGIGIRMHEKWTKDNSRVVTSEGKNRSNADGTEARWCDLSLLEKGKISGMLFMSNPNNQQHPEPMRVWPMDANGGRGDMFFEFCPIRHKSWNLLPGVNYVLNYRMLVYDEKITPQTAENLWRDFAFPPTVTFE